MVGSWKRTAVFSEGAGPHKITEATDPDQGFGTSYMVLPRFEQIGKERSFSQLTLGGSLEIGDLRVFASELTRQPCEHSHGRCLMGLLHGRVQRDAGAMDPP